MDQSKEILLGYATFTSSEYGYHHIAHSISNKINTLCLKTKKSVSAAASVKQMSFQ